MTDLEKFISILHSAGTEYFAYSDCNSVGDLINIIIIFVDGIAIFHKFVTYEENDNMKKQEYLGCGVEKEYKSLDELVAEVCS